MRIALATLAFALCTSNAFAVNVEIGRGLGTSSIAPIRYVAPSPDDAGAAAILYRTSDLAALPPNTSITTISFEKTAGGAVPNTAIAIALKNTSATSLTSGSTLSAELAGAIEHVNVVKSVTDAPGWVDFALATPFVYTGGGIEIIVTWDSNSGARANGDIFWKQHGTGSTVCYLEAYGPDAALTSAQMFPAAGSPEPRPNIRFDRTATSNPWVVVTSGLTVLADGGAYQASQAFRNGVTYPNRLHVENVGGAVAPLGDFVFVNPMSAALAAVTQPPATLAAGLSADIEYTHTPNANNVLASYGVTIGTFDFTNQGNTFSGGGTPELDLWVKGPTGNAAPLTNGGQTYLGAVVVGQEIYYTGIIANVGTAALNLSGTPAVTISAGTNITVSDVVQPAVSTVSVGSDLTFGFALTATAPINDTGVTVAIANDDPNEGSMSTQLRMRAVTVTTPPTGSPEIDVARSGGIPIADGSTFNESVDPTQSLFLLNYTVFNLGDAPLELSPAVIFNEAGCAATIVTNLPSTIAEGGNAVLSITVARDGTDDGAFSVSIGNNDVGESPYDFTVGIPSSNSPNIVVSNTDVGDLIAGFGVTRDVLIQNTGLADLVVSDVTIEGADNVQVLPLTPASFTLAPGTSQAFAMTLLSTAVGGYVFDVVATSNDPDTNPYRLVLSGSVTAAGEAPDEGCAAVPSSSLLLGLALGALMRLGKRGARVVS